jgi:hypothetical protein
MKAFKELSEPALVWTGRVMLEGRIAVPPDPVAVVIFASVPALPDDERDARIMNELYEAHVATLYVPLVTEEELQFDSRTSHFRFDADFLAQRFIDVALWAVRNKETKELPAGLVGSSGSAAGAIVAAAQRPQLVTAVVSIDGRTDLAVDYLRDVKTPTLLIVKDMPVLRMNREALMRIHAERRIEIVHGADFEAVDSVARKAAQWLSEKLSLTFA